MKHKKQQNRAPERDYDVGYRRPPKHTQFKKGQSGNPKGRPKGAKNLRTIVNGVLDKPIKVHEEGEARSVTRFEALFISMYARAMKGDNRAAELILRAKERAEQLDGNEGEGQKVLDELYALIDGKSRGLPGRS
jgi:hypothetical protein